MTPDRFNDFAERHGLATRANYGQPFNDTLVAVLGELMATQKELRAAVELIGARVDAMEHNRRTETHVMVPTP